MSGRLAIAVGLLAYVALTAIAGWAVRRRITDARTSNRFVDVSHVGTDRSGDWVEFPPGSFAAHPGVLYLTSPSGGSRLTLSQPERHSDVVRRYVTSGDTSALRREKRGRLSGYVEATPAACGLGYFEVQHHRQRMWMVPGKVTGRDSVWVIHVHGLGSSRSQVLRGVETFSDLGFTSLVPTYRTSLENQAGGAVSSHLGISEWKDVVSAQEYALASGAERILFVGWSLGASIALQTIRRAPCAHVAGALLISPALDWREIILTAASSMGAPRLLTKWALSGFNAIRADGEPYIDLHNLPGISHATDGQVPILIFHGTDDDSVPIRLSSEAVERSGGQIHLVKFPNAHHTLEWNSNPALWDQEIRAWCSALHLLNDTPTNLEAA